MFFFSFFWESLEHVIELRLQEHQGGGGQIPAKKQEGHRVSTWMDLATSGDGIRIREGDLSLFLDLLQRSGEGGAKLGTEAGSHRAYWNDF